MAAGHAGQQCATDQNQASATPPGREKRFDLQPDVSWGPVTAPALLWPTRINARGRSSIALCDANRARVIADVHSAPTGRGSVSCLFPAFRPLLRTSCRAIFLRSLREALCVLPPGGLFACGLRESLAHDLGSASCQHFVRCGGLMLGYFPALPLGGFFLSANGEILSPIFRRLIRSRQREVRVLRAGPEARGAGAAVRRRRAGRGQLPAKAAPQEWRRRRVRRQ